MDYRLGLDVGTNSLGWCVLELNDRGEPCRIAAAGSRIFADGRDNKSKATLKATRREARSARRRRDRYLQRRSYLLAELIKHDLFPADRDEQLRLQKLNPLEIREIAIQDKEIPLHHFGRALFHLNQRRGFKSNRKDKSEENTTGKVSQSARNLLEEMGLIDAPLPKEDYAKLTKSEKQAARRQESANRREALEKLSANKSITFGSFLFQRQQEGKPTRARPSSDGKLYDVYPTRDLLEDEFDKLWRNQSRFYPNILTDSLQSHFKKIIFFQRELKPPAVGKCSYLPEEKRTFRAMPSFQRYRILQEVNSLKWWNYTTQEHEVREYRPVRDEIVRVLQEPSVKTNPSHRNCQVTFKGIKKVLKDFGKTRGESEITLNFESPKRTGFDGNPTTNVMRHEDYVGPDWLHWPIKKQDEFISTILDEDLDDETVIQQLQNEFGLEQFNAEKCANAPLAEGTANVSLKAAMMLADKMENEMLLQSEAVEKLSLELEAFSNPSLRRREGELLPQLPYYGEAVEGHIIPGRGNEPDEQARIGMVSNPTVHIAMNQLRIVVNELMKRFGHPKSIAIELGRDLPTGKEGRSEIEREQKKFQDANQRFDNVLIEHGQKCNRDNRLRLRLWEDQDKTCPFSGRRISVSELFSPAFEIEHLIPFSRSLDDSRANKVIADQMANKKKGNQTPYEAFGNDPQGYEWSAIFERSKKLPNAQRWRFQQDAMEIWLKQCDDFSERHLNDTRYIGRLAKEYLENICPFNKIDVLPGRLTALLRHHWGLNSILQNLGAEDRKNSKQHKNRNDHRHHAIDAIVIGMTTRSMIQKVATEANKAEEIELDRLFETKDRRSAIDPWENFRTDVQYAIDGIIVSHKRRSKKLRKGATDGQLHNETAYGLVSEFNPDGPSDVVSRWPIEKFMAGNNTQAKLNRINRIRDNHLRSQFINAFNAGGEDNFRALAEQKGIRSLRCVEPKSVIPIGNDEGKAYKYYQGDANWGVEIFEHQGNWIGRTITRFEANKPNFKPGETYRPHPSSRLLMRLQINDLIVVSDEIMTVYRVQKIGRQITLAPHHEANVAERDSNTNDEFRYWSPTVSGLKKAGAKKAHVSSTGLLSFEKPRRIAN